MANEKRRIRIPKLFTREFLKKLDPYACSAGLNEFARIFPKGAAPTGRNIEKLVSSPNININAICSITLRLLPDEFEIYKRCRASNRFPKNYYNIVGRRLMKAAREGKKITVQPYI